MLDAAQSLGHVDVDLGADAVYATSRKWLAGPRGVGVLCVRPSLAAELTPLLPEPEGRPASRPRPLSEAERSAVLASVAVLGVEEALTRLLGPSMPVARRRPGA